MHNLTKILNRLKIIEPSLYRKCHSQVPKIIRKTHCGKLQQLELAYEIKPNAVERAICNAEHPVDMLWLGYSASNFFYTCAMRQACGSFGARDPSYSNIIN
jgi:hypothetical protein